MEGPHKRTRPTVRDVARQAEVSVWTASNTFSTTNTFSAGVTDFRAEDTQLSVTKRADEAMYAAKQAGKNRVLVG